MVVRYRQQHPVVVSLRISVKRFVPEEVFCVILHEQFPCGLGVIIPDIDVRASLDQQSCSL